MRPHSTILAALLTLPLLVSLSRAQQLIYGINGGGTGGSFGAATASADVDGDGKLDALVGAPDDDSAGIAAGMVRAYDAGGTTILFTLLGPNDGGRFGASITALGDLDGDGGDDFAVGAPADNASTGAVYVYSGKTHTLLYKRVGQAASDQFGFSVADLGDVDGDNKHDLGVGAPFHDVGGANAGNVRIYSGPSGGLLNTIPGVGAGDRFGYALVGFGDIDGDGRSDFIVGAPYQQSPTGQESGWVYGYSGKTATLLWSYYGSSAFGHWGASVARLTNQRVAISQPDRIGAGQPGGFVGVYNAFFFGLGFVGGWVSAEGFGTSIDGFAPSSVANDYVVIGSPLELSGEGGVYVLDASNSPAPPVITLNGSIVNEHVGRSVASFGFNGGVSAPRILAGAPGAEENNAGAKVGSLTKATTTSTTTVYGNSFGEQLGASVAFVGDVDGDGTPDFVIGAPKADAAVPDGGLARVTSGADGSVILSLQGQQTGAQFGASVGGAGDYDNDGVPDVIVGSPLETVGSAAEAGRARVFSGKTGNVLDTSSTSNAGDHYGASVAGAGDVNADGYADVIVGAPHGGGGDLGLARIYSGKTGGLLQAHLGDTLADELGTSVAGLGDPTGDGFADCGVGAPFHVYSGIGGSTGFLRVYSGADGSGVATIHAATSSQLGLSIGNARDVDDDGTPDLIAGALNLGSGLVPVNRGAVLVFSGKTHALLFSAVGDAANDRLGASVVGIGDVNKDGFAEFAAGATMPIPPFNFFGPGYVRVFNGADGAPLMTIDGDNAVDQLGACVARAGDLNGDGASDLLVGAPTASGFATNGGLVRAYSVAPKGLSIFGTGTPGCSGSETLYGNSTPKHGNAEFRLTTVKSPASSLGLLILGNGSNVAGSDPFGLGILFHVNFFTSTELYGFNMLIDAGGHGQAAVPIPNNLAIVGHHFYAQSISAWQNGPCSPSPFGLSSTPGLEITFQ